MRGASPRRARSSRRSRSSTRGGVAAYPTDSIYALGCAIEARDAIERIYRAKAMHKNQRLALICPDLSTASEFGQFSQTAFRLAQRIFPGPYTLVVPATHEVPRTLTAPQASHGRHPRHRAPDRAGAASRRSAARSSPRAPSRQAPDEPCRDAEEILDVFGKLIDVVIDSEQTEAAPSTVLEVDGEDDQRDPRGPGLPRRHHRSLTFASG